MLSLATPVTHSSPTMRWHAPTHASGSIALGRVLFRACHSGRVHRPPPAALARRTCAWQRDQQGCQARWGFDSQHLWESMAFDTHIRTLTVEQIRTVDTTFNIRAREYIAEY